MVRRLKSATEHDMTVGGADLAGQAIRAGLVDEL
jgi:dihydrofolate reductase